MKKIILLMAVSLLLVGCGNQETRKSYDKQPTNITSTTESTTPTTTTTTTTKKTTTKANSVKFGESSLKYGKYVFKQDDLKATIIINDDHTATYVGNVDMHGNTRKKIDTKGTWKIRENQKYMEGPDVSYADYIDFTWDNGTKESYWAYQDSFGDQWHTFTYKK